MSQRNHHCQHDDKSHDNEQGMDNVNYEYEYQSESEYEYECQHDTNNCNQEHNQLSLIDQIYLTFYENRNKALNFDQIRDYVSRRFNTHNLHCM